MGQGKRLHLSSERMALLVSGAPAFDSSEAPQSITPLLMKRVQTLSYGFDYAATQLREIGSHEYIKDRSTTGITPLDSRIPILAQPVVGLQFQYLFFDANNEENINFNIGSPSDGDNEKGLLTLSPLYQSPVFDGINFDTLAEKGDVNFYVLVEDSSERKDIVGREGSSPFADLDLIGFGNCYISNYSISAALGSFVSCSVDYACSNMTFDVIGDSNPKCPAVDNDGERSTADIIFDANSLKEAFEIIPVKYDWSPSKTYAIGDRVRFEEETYEAVQPSISETPQANASYWVADTSTSLALSPGDMSVKLINNKPAQDETKGFHSVDLNEGDASIQSLDINIPIERKDINGFGSNYMKDRKIQFPILCTLDLNFLARDFEKKGQISNIFNDDIDYDLIITLYSRSDSINRKEKATIKVHNAKLNSEQHSTSIGGFSSIDASFVFEITPSPDQCGMEIIRPSQ